ncbi:hypothetical protein T492DRAFT_953760 [Pavlovales sp. CCMP2436]|nr:hypothetical protein T492DRAFT_953760 [Pavlovales sp. CCMP2436]|mmetsp:Transcript_39111/g.96966  ORF Transcript_39111/g.96966 Transcript_39111/m.96966 type:complete len:237 (+) Transcript_39111:2-712(+)
MRSTLTRRLTTVVPALMDARSIGASPSRLFINLLVERSFLVYPPEPEWKLDHLARTDRWRLAYRQDFPPEFYAKLDPREAPRATYLEAVDRVLAQHADLPNPHDPDEHSIHRRMTRRIYLLANAGGAWGYPRCKMPVTDGSVSMRAVILGLVRAQLGPQLKCLHLSRAPIAHLLAADGSLDVFFKLKHVIGVVKPGDENEPAHVAWDDHAWLVKEEAMERLGSHPSAALSGRIMLD